MAAAVTVTNIDNTMEQFIVDGIIALTGKYGTSGGADPHGDPLDLSGLGVPSNSLPTLVQIVEQSPAGALSSGNTYEYMPGTTQANGQLQIRAAGGGEITPGGAYGTPPFSVTGFVLFIRAWFPSFI